MKNYIKKIKNKPEHERKKFLILWMFVSMVIVVFIWVYSLGSRFNGSTKEKVREDIQPFNMFKDTISETINSVSDNLKNINE